MVKGLTAIRCGSKCALSGLIWMQGVRLGYQGGDRMLEKATLALLGSCSVLVMSGCAHFGKKADLSPVADPRPGFGFCRLVESGPDEGKLVVTVKNDGNKTAPESTTRVEFLPGGSIDIVTPAIPPGSSIDLPPTAFPTGCHNPDCVFRITADWEATVKEKNEANNTGSGSCIG